MLNSRQCCIMSYALKHITHDKESALKKIIQNNILIYDIEFEAAELAANTDIYNVIKMNFSENDLRKTKTNIQDGDIVKALHLAFIEEKLPNLIFHYQAGKAMAYCDEQGYTGYLLDACN